MSETATLPPFFSFARWFRWPTSNEPVNTTITEEVKVEGPIAEDEVKVEGPIAEDEVKVEVPIAEDDVKVEEQIAEDDVKVEEQIAEDDVRMEEPIVTEKTLPKHIVEEPTPEALEPEPEIKKPKSEHDDFSQPKSNHKKRKGGKV